MRKVAANGNRSRPKLVGGSCGAEAKQDVAAKPVGLGRLPRCASASAAQPTLPRQTDPSASAVPTSNGTQVALVRFVFVTQNSPSGYVQTFRIPEIIPMLSNQSERFANARWGLIALLLGLPLPIVLIAFLFFGGCR